MYYVYVLRSLKDNKLYIGYTNNLTRRLTEHNKGSTKSTKHRRPFRLAYQESYKTKSEAAKREWYFKNTAEGDILKRGLVRQTEELRK